MTPASSNDSKTANSGDDNAIDWRDEFTKHLTEHGLRMTRQRLAIAEIFFDSDGHPNIEQLTTVVRDAHPDIGQATVYRTLKLLVDSGLATAARLGGAKTRYEPNLDDDHHDHLVCTKCGRVVEFHNEELEALQETIATGFGFKLTGHEMELYGLPFECETGPCPYEGKTKTSP